MDYSFMGTIRRNITPRGATWVVILITLGFFIITLTLDSGSKPESVDTPTRVIAEDFLKTSVSNIKRQGKLVVTTMDVQTYNTSVKEGFMYRGELTTISMGKVQFVMDLHDFDPNWASLQDNQLLVVIPRNFLKADLIETKSTDVDNSGWFAPKDATDALRENNKTINTAKMLSEVNTMVDMVRPSAEKELENLFRIPLKATGQNVTVKVTFG